MIGLERISIAEKLWGIDYHHGIKKCPASLKKIPTKPY